MKISFEETFYMEKMLGNYLKIESNWRILGNSANF